MLRYHDNTKLILIAGLAVAFGSQNATARQFGIQELSTTVLTSTIVGIGVDSRLAGGTGQREKLRYSVVLTMCAGAVVGATMSRFTVAPVIALAAVVVAVSAVHLPVRAAGSGDRRLGSRPCHQFSSPARRGASAGRSSTIWRRPAGT